jgi:hypothetical protein
MKSGCFTGYILIFFLYSSENNDYVKLDIENQINLTS